MRLIDADELKKCAIPCEIHNGTLTDLCVPLYQIDNAPTVEDRTREVLSLQETIRKLTKERPHGEYVDISKLRLMTVEECAGHTIDYAMGWKACVEWIKKGGAV